MTKVKKTNFVCDILNCEIYVPCRLLDCPYFFSNEENFNCIRFYSKGQPLRVEEIAYVLSIPVSLVKNVKRMALLNLRRRVVKLMLIGDYKIDDSYLSDMAMSASSDDQLNVINKHFNCDPTDVIKAAYNMSYNVLATSEVIGMGYSKTNKIVKSDNSKVDRSNGNGKTTLFELINSECVRRITEQCEWHNHINAKLFNKELSKIQKEYKR